MVDKAPDADAFVTPPPTNAVAGTRVSDAAGAVASWSLVGDGRGAVYSVDTITTSLPFGAAPTCDSDTIWETVASASACPSPELSAADGGGGAADPTTWVATTSRP
jgi:hypothetical protein